MLEKNCDADLALATTYTHHRRMQSCVETQDSREQAGVTGQSEIISQTLLGATVQRGRPGSGVNFLRSPSTPAAGLAPERMGSED
jgi:hypothetical protein